MSGTRLGEPIEISRGRVVRVLVACCVCQMGLGVAYFYGATLKYIVAEFEWSRAAFAAASAPLLLAMALASPAAGSFTERFGARRVLVVSVPLIGLSLWLFSRMQSLVDFYLISILFGIALTGVGDIVLGSVVSRWVSRGRGLALGFVYSGSNLGGALIPVIAVWVAARGSWRDALVVVGAGAVALILPFALFGVREPPAGYRPPPAEQEAALPEPGRTPASLDLRQALRTRSFWVLGFVLFTFYFYYLAITQHLVAFLGDRGFSDQEAALGFGLAIFLGVFSKLGIGLLADRIPYRRALIINFTLLTGGSFALLGVGVPGFLPCFLIAHGFSVAAENVLLPLIVVDCFGVEHMARIYGVLMVSLFPGGVLGPIFAGALYDRLGDYQLAFTMLAVLNLLGLVALVWVRRERELHGSA